MKQYGETQKQKVRTEALSYAIQTLTEKRHLSTVARKSYVRDVKNYLLKNGDSNDIEIVSQLTESEIQHWEAFYEATIRTKKPQELRVAYLSGPNPENDIEVLVNFGILPENIWAFESDNKTYDKAILSALESKFPFVKIYKGRIENYLKILPFKFDIIYLDFCTSICGEKTMSVIRDIFNYQKLETLGILITNFALPPSDNANNSEFRKNLILMSANYLYSKNFTERLTENGGGFTESAEVCGLDFDSYIQIAKENESNFYSQFITRILFELPSVIIPYQRIANNETLTKLFFSKFNNEAFDEYYYESLMSFPNEHSLYWSLRNKTLDNESFQKILNNFLRQLSLNSSEDLLVEKVKLVHYYLSENLNSSFHSDKLDMIKKNWNFAEKYVFCDMFLFHQLKEVLVSQLTNPYIYNIEYCNRWQYKAKSTEMFMDLITYDECRYIFDWMPSLDMFAEGLEDWNRQLSLRFAMDSIGKQQRWYGDDFFSGTSVIDQFTESFEAKELTPRVLID